MLSKRSWNRAIALGVLIWTASSSMLARSEALEASPSSSRDLAEGEIDLLFSLGKGPMDIGREHIERLFSTSLTRMSCDDIDWSCRWVGALRNDAPSITNALLPNPKAGKYTGGGDFVMEVPRNICVRPEAITRRVSVKPVPQSTPPTHLSYTPQDTPFPQQAMSVFEKIPGMAQHVRLTTWTEDGCVIRIELDTLINDRN